MKKSLNLILTMSLPYGMWDASMTAITIVLAMAALGMNFDVQIVKERCIALQESSRLILSSAKHTID